MLFYFCLLKGGKNKSLSLSLFLLSPPPPPFFYRCGDATGFPACIDRSAAASQSSPSYSPSPLVATAPSTCHRRPRIYPSPNASHSAAGLIAPGKSCLLAKISTAALRISGSSTIDRNSAEALSTRSRSAQSTT